MEAALYDPTDGFFTRGRGPAGRGDFLTSPETGSLFGVLVARALDREWVRLGRPEPFTVVEAGAGDGRLAREVLRAEPACIGALDLVLVERSPAARAAQRERLPAGSPVRSLEDLPAEPCTGMVLANELLDNLPFGIAEARGGRWTAVLVGREGDRFVEVHGPLAAADLDLVPSVDSVPDGARVPIVRAAVDWIGRAAGLIADGALLLIDYAAPARTLVERGGWLRTYAGHRRGDDPYAAPGARDITTDVPLEPVRAALAAAGLEVVGETTQADWAAGLGISALVEEGRRIWAAGAARGDLAAIAGRSRAVEAATLTDPSGLGGFVVIEARRRGPGGDG
ncbi:MAG: SAM-dependent methyltransferase [Actinomycetes bacterium]